MAAIAAVSPEPARPVPVDPVLLDPPIHPPERAGAPQPATVSGVQRPVARPSSRPSIRERRRHVCRRRIGMECKVCGSNNGICGQRQSRRNFFHIRLTRDDFDKQLVVPCYALKKFNKATWSSLYVETDDKEKYKFNLVKLSKTTCILGGDYQKFFKHYDMKHGDEIRLDMQNEPPYLFMYPLDKLGRDKPRVDDEFEFKNTARTVVVSKNLVLSNAEIARINRVVRTRGLGLGGVFVHKLTESDIENNKLHIPKFIASDLGIPRRGNVRLVGDGDGEVIVKKTAYYYTTTDGRICFNKAWKSFAKKKKLVAGKVVVIMFKKSAYGPRFSFDEVRF